jgi:hypothetical protein
LRLEVEDRLGFARIGTACRFFAVWRGHDPVVTVAHDGGNQYHVRGTEDDGLILCDGGDAGQRPRAAGNALR